MIERVDHLKELIGNREDPSDPLAATPPWFAMPDETAKDRGEEQPPDSTSAEGTETETQRRSRLSEFKVQELKVRGGGIEETRSERRRSDRRDKFRASAKGETWPYPGPSSN